MYPISSLQNAWEAPYNVSITTQRSGSWIPNIAESPPIVRKKNQLSIGICVCRGGGYVSNHGLYGFGSCAHRRATT